MAADEPADTSGTGPSTEAPSQVSGAADALPLHILAVAADPALAPTLSGGVLDLVHDSAASLTIDTMHYDGHVALALDADALPGVNSLLDLLVVSHDLFDIPAIDAVLPVDDSTPT